MSSTTASTGDSAHARLVDLARRHLWMHMATAEADGEAMAILTRGEGCYVWDDRGKRYLDGLAGLFAVNVGHGRAELAAAAGSQAGELPFFPIWGNAHPPAIELAARLAGLAPDHLNRVFFTSGGSEAVETAWKLARQYFRAIGQPKRSKVIARNCAAVALANIDIMEREDIPGRVRRFEGEFKTVLDGLRDIPIVGDVRGTGYFYAIELVRDATTKESLSAEECRTVLKGTLARRMVELGLLCRADDRAEPVVVLAPPLVAGPEQFAEIAGILRVALTEAAVALGRA